MLRASVSIRYPVPPNPEAWVIPEEPVPESTAHGTAVLRILLLLSAWAEQQPGRVRVVRLGGALARAAPAHRYRLTALEQERAALQQERAARLQAEEQLRALDTKVRG